jgi:hypothetical protein
MTDPLKAQTNLPQACQGVQETRLRTPFSLFVLEYSRGTEYTA